MEEPTIYFNGRINPQSGSRDKKPCECYCARCGATATQIIFVRDQLYFFCDKCAWQYWLITASNVKSCVSASIYPRSD